MIKLCFQAFLGLSTQIMEFEYKQAYKTIETGVLVWKSKVMTPYQPIFYFGSNMLKAKWWTDVSYGLLPNNAECICKKVAKIEATGSTRFQNTLWNRIDLDRTS